MNKKQSETNKATTSKALPNSSNYLKEVGKRLAEGVLLTLGKWLLVLILLMVALNMLRNFMAWGVDDSDVSAWKRSGLRIYTDHLTGVQYVSDGNSLTVRVHPDGSPVFQDKTKNDSQSLDQ